jgi:hypothetical protein
MNRNFYISLAKKTNKQMCKVMLAEKIHLSKNTETEEKIELLLT